MLFEATDLKKFSVLLTIIVFIGMLTGCSPNGGSSNQRMIEPGDKIGDFTISKGQEGSFTYGFSVDCSEGEDNTTYNCSAPLGEVINVSTGMYSTTGNASLDEVWTRSNYQMTIADRSVDLAAFGTIDYTHPQVGTIRFANVVITTHKPGQITVKDSGIFDNGDPFSSTSTYVFSNP
jgi:hypothetical protein